MSPGASVVIALTSALQAAAMCPPGTTSGNSSGECVACHAGRWSAAGTAACIECAAGKWTSLPGATACAPCPSGTWSTARGLLSESACANCTAGKYSSQEGASSEDSCHLCIAGKWGGNEGATSASMCIDCPSGTWRHTAGATSQNDCVRLTSAGSTPTSTPVTPTENSAISYSTFSQFLDKPWGQLQWTLILGAILLVVGGICVVFCCRACTRRKDTASIASKRGAATCCSCDEQEETPLLESPSMDATPSPQPCPTEQAPLPMMKRLLNMLAQACSNSDNSPRPAGGTVRNISPQYVQPYTFGGLPTPKKTQSSSAHVPFNDLRPNMQGTPGTWLRPPQGLNLNVEPQLVNPAISSLSSIVVPVMTVVSSIPHHAPSSPQCSKSFQNLSRNCGNIEMDAAATGSVVPTHQTQPAMQPSFLHGSSEMRVPPIRVAGHTATETQMPETRPFGGQQSQSNWESTAAPTMVEPTACGMQAVNYSHPRGQGY